MCAHLSASHSSSLTLLAGVVAGDMRAGRNELAVGLAVVTDRIGAS